MSAEAACDCGRSSVVGYNGAPKCQRCFDVIVELEAGRGWESPLAKAWREYWAWVLAERAK